ncbi:hypothetical protein HWB90_gp009 [Mycobacterium phage Fowlmouth]|uniref:Uncharacterized protein n=2 Tax=Fowlmouthvirus fowlmouth TaxID=2845652 RepID=A0A7G8LPQ2_9CAUD|nr:hypothetical protein HWB90_gp009 [Mycobacterium phage Fowlmouth]AYN57959.1 minor capsid protein [Mycobacterium phage Fowlmouth]QNJ59224.1 minor capsid protein [Mycobacterium phage MrMiyagi]
MSRYDKYDPKVGGYRATLAADWATNDVEHAVAVGHDANGRVVKGAGVSGVKGVLVLTKAYKAGTRVDVMTSGDIIEFGPYDGTSVAGVDFADTSTNYYGHADGTVTDTQDDDGVYIGHTVDNGRRLVVRVVPLAAIPAPVETP